MPRTDKGGKRLSLRCHQQFLERDALVTGKDRLANADQTVTVAHRRRHMGDFVSTWFPLFG